MPATSSGSELPAPGSVPTRLAAAWYWIRVARHVLLRSVRDAFDPAVRRHPAHPAADRGALLAEYRSPLWQDDGSESEFTLVAGKVHNLRIAARVFDGIVVPQGEQLSFWKQLGRPGRGRGFVVGREIREGCVVPTLAGGLCQLSNALVRCADAAGLEIVERWGHTARPVGEEPSAGDALDATVFWNYLDLRILARRAFRLEVALDAVELQVRIFDAPASRHGETRAGRGGARRSGRRIVVREAPASPPPARGCLTCEESSCFRHASRPTAVRGSSAVLVDAWAPELARWVAQREAADWLLPWVRPARRVAGQWQVPTGRRAERAVLVSLWRSFRLRRAAGEGARRQAALIAGQALLARSYARRLRPEHTHLIVDQQLLLPLAGAGALGGRSYDVLLTALPSVEVQARLDAASRAWPAARSLVDFRLDAGVAQREAQLLARARRCVTAHRDVARHVAAWGACAIELLDWVVPVPVERRRQRPESKPVVGFPASALARKGVHELASALRELGWPVLVLGTPATDASLWHGIELRQARYRDDWPAQVDLVALPAYVEHAPRALLRAWSNGIPVVVTPACGLPPGDGVFEVAAGDVAGLVAALRAAWASCLRADAADRLAAA